MTAEFLRIADMPLAQLTPYPGNAKRGIVDRIRESIRLNGQYRAMVVREHKAGRRTVHTILAGNHTAVALAEEGHTEGRCEIIRCDEETARRINMADNRTAELGDYDLPALLAQAAAGSLEGTGWTGEEIARLQADAEAAAEAALADLVDGGLDDLPGELDPERQRDNPDGGHTRMSAHQLRWQHADITMTAEERQALDEAYDEYLDLHGTDFGFIRALLRIER